MVTVLYILVGLTALVSAAMGQIPNVFEFCSALMSDQRSSQTSACSSDPCTGRPGKRGSPGIQGPPGLKGDIGEQGTCEGLMQRQELFETEIRQKFDLIPKLQYCSMGMRSGGIPDEAITASSVYADYRFQSHNARMDSRVMWTSATSITNCGAWCPATINSGEWIQVHLGSPKSVSGVVTQGRPKNHWGNQNWVKTFKISCGQNEDDLRFIVGDNGSDKIFVGNSDKDAKVINKFPSVKTCRIIRLYPLTWNTDSPFIRGCLRMEILRGECFDIL